MYKKVLWSLEARFLNNISLPSPLYVRHKRRLPFPRGSFGPQPTCTSFIRTLTHSAHFGPEDGGIIHHWNVSTSAHIGTKWKSEMKNCEVLKSIRMCILYYTKNCFCKQSRNPFRLSGKILLYWDIDWIMWHSAGNFNVRDLFTYLPGARNAG